MLKTMCAAGILTWAVTAVSGADFPLQFKALKAEEAWSLPGGYGVSGPISTSKPRELKKEPKARSLHPLYGQLGEGDNKKGVLFRLDEPRGDGKGYDELIIDFNQNGDLTDDTPAQRNRSLLRRSVNNELLSFGPIEAPADKRIGVSRPTYYAEANIYRQRSGTSRSLQNVSFNGRLRMKPGWYLETTVVLPGTKQTIAIVDTDCNLRLSDPWKPMTYRSDEDTNWYFRAGDTFLQDLNGSGKFDSDRFPDEFCSFGPLLYFGANPCKLTLAADLKSLRVDPWPEPLAEVTLQPNGANVHSLTLAWETQNNQWQLIEPAVRNGKIKVPPGNYRLYSCALTGQAASREQVMASGHQWKVNKPLRLEAGKPNTLTCGAPLEIQVTASKEPTGRTLATSRSTGSSTRTKRAETEFALQINGVVVGAGGEIYSSYGQGKNFESEPPNPVFAVLDSQGKQLFSGKLEFG